MNEIEKKNHLKKINAETCAAGDSERWLWLYGVPFDAYYKYQKKNCLIWSKVVLSNGSGKHNH